MNPSSHALILADYAIIVGFFVVMLAVGFYFAGRVRDAKDYFAAGKQVPWWLSGISFWMSSFSAFAFVAHSRLAYEHGCVPITMWWLGAVVTVITAHLVAARWRRVATTSPMEFVEERYGIGMRQSLSWLGAVLVLLDDALKIVAVGSVVSAALGFPLHLAIFWCGLIMLAYTLLGGLWAVLVTDMVQFIVMLTAVVVLVPLALARVGGIGPFVENLPGGFFSPTEPGKYTWFYLITFALLVLLNFSTRWSLVQRFYAVGSDRDARKVGYLVAVLNCLVAPLFVLPAMAASIFLPGLEDPEQVYGLVCRELLPAGMLGMLVAAIFSATMSSLSSDYNAVASVLTTDVYRRLVAPRASERDCVSAGRVFTLFVGLATMVLALWMVVVGEDLSLFDMMVVIFVVLGPPTSIPVIVGLMSRRISNAGAICGVATGMIASLVARFCGVAILEGLDALLQPLLGRSIAVEAIPEPVHMLTAIVATFAGIAVGTLLMPGSAQQRARVERFLDGMRALPAASEPAPATADASWSPARVVGLSVAALGALLIAVTLVLVPLAESILTLGVGGSMLVVGCVLVWFPRARRGRASAEA